MRIIITIFPKLLQSREEIPFIISFDIAVNSIYPKNRGDIIKCISHCKICKPAGKSEPAAFSNNPISAITAKKYFFLIHVKLHIKYTGVLFVAAAIVHNQFLKYVKNNYQSHQGQ